MRRFFLVVLASLSLAWSGATAAERRYENPDLASDAVRLEAQVGKIATGFSGQTAAQLKGAVQAALARKDTAAALAVLAAQAGKAPKDPAAWLAYSRGALTLADDVESRQIATTAAFLAYQRATTGADKATALLALAESYARRELWRPALVAYRASLGLVDAAPVRKIYESLQESHGFRIVGYKVDNESAAPRACFEFSEPLARGKTDFAPYVAISGQANGAISTEEQQLCVEGLKHGEHYAIVLRPALPSAEGETLGKSTDYEIYVRDRSPQVRFTGRNYVLPRTGQEGIPVVSVNTPRIDVEIVRIGDRNLLPTIRSEDFLGQLYPYRLKQYVEGEGTKIWSGTLDVAPELNTEVTTAFPVLEAVGRLEPGVYVMAASPSTGAPAADSDGDEDSYDAKATQWFIVSDLGLTAFSGKDGIHVLVRSLATAKPAAASLRLVARNNEVLATKATDASGHVRFDPGLSRGTGGLAPGLLVAEDGKGDYGFLDLTQSAFDLTDRGVAGREPPKALDALVFSERGVYRSGETVYLTALLRDGKGLARDGLPLTLVVKRPDGVEHKRVQVADEGQGGRAYALPLSTGVSPGTWRVEAFVDPKAEPVGTTTFLVEDYVPERLELTLTAAAKAARSGEPLEIDALARYLYGAPGADLEIAGNVEVQEAEDSHLPALQGYEAGLSDEEFATVATELEETWTTDAAGKAKLRVPIPDVTAPHLLEAKVILRAGEPGGRAVECSLVLPILPKAPVIGVRKTFEQLTEGAAASFDVIAVGTDGTRLARKGVTWSLYKVSNDYQWYRADGRWSYERVKSSKRVATGTVDLAATAPAKISAVVGLGDYRLDVASATAGDLPTSVSFESGWSGTASADTPDLLEVGLDRQAYATGDTMRVRITSRFAGTATLAILGESSADPILLDLKEGETVETLPVSRDWGTSAYVVVLAHRPLDAAARRMPGRALGLAWFSIDAEAHKLEVALPVPEKAHPRQPLSVPIEIKGLSAGEETRVVVAAVDVGILNLTRYEWPDPRTYFFGQRLLAADIRDLYGFLIDGMQGTRGAIRSGGDEGASLGAEKPTQEPLALYSGLVKVGADGKAKISFDLPAFNGTVRVMALAWGKTKVGAATKDVIIRDPVVVQATAPRFLADGDQSRFHIQIDNVEGPAGDYALEVTPAGGLSVASEALRRKVKLEAKARKAFTVPVTAKGIGRAEVALKLSGPGLVLDQKLALNVTPATLDLYRRGVRTLEPGTSLTVSKDLLADFVHGTGVVSVALSPIAGVDVPALLQALDRYPYGCTEQIVSRALPLLYVNKLATSAHLGIDPDTDQRVRDAIERVLSRQDSSGAFGLWSAADADDMWLHAYTSDFLTRAREANFSVPQKAMDAALERLRNLVANSAEIGAGQGPSVAYGAYVLARNGRPVMGDLRYLADTKIDRLESPLSRAHLAAALALLGDRTRAATVFAKAAERLSTIGNPLYSQADYGSRLRDGAALVALAVETDMANAEIQRAVRIVEDARAKTSLTTTQENAFLTLAAEALAGSVETVFVSIDGAPQQGALYRSWTAKALDAGKATIENNGKAPVKIVLGTSGNPIQPEPAAERGYKVERAYFTLAGEPIAPGALKQNDRIVVALTITESEAAAARLLLVDHLPAGLEIDNPALYEGGSTESLGFLESKVTPVHADYRDDRFVAAFNRDGSDKATFSVAYIARAVTPGHYVLPAATIEDMYRPERFGRTGFGAIDIGERK
jgi:uncharacterized protein YfaS (alpha-2-macroglobulin family)